VSSQLERLKNAFAGQYEIDREVGTVRASFPEASRALQPMRDRQAATRRLYIGGLLAPMAILIDQPWLAACLGGLLVGLGRWRARRTAVMAGSLWLLYWAYETGMQLRWLCSGECNIRIDLLLIYPLLLLATILGAVSLFRGHPAPGRPG
jgi:hypothetical protein